jgi:hypothetical protein
MPRIDFSKVDDVQDFSPIPDGKYPCRLTDIEEASTNAGDEMWKMRFQVAEGPHAGRMIFDNLVFSDAAMKRAKLVCSRLGLDVSGELDLTPEKLKGRSCLLTVQTEEYEDQEGRRRKRNVVPFAGYERAAGEGSAMPAETAAEEEDPAF